MLLLSIQIASLTLLDMGVGGTADAFVTPETVYASLHMI